MITTTVSTLPPVSEADRQRILTAPRNAQSHQDLMAQVAAMNAVQIGGDASAEVLPDNLTVAAWNVERGLFPEENSTVLRSIDPDIVLLSEVDHGMARTGQRHTTEEMASALGMTYAYGVEFHELDLGGPTERAFCADDFNALGWHGNAILSSVPFEKVAMLRLDDHGHWFAANRFSPDPEQPRLGGRMALLAIVNRKSGALCLVSTHLESNADAAYRHQQFARLLAAVEDFAPNLPVLIGGDLNTGNQLPPDFDWQRETLFEQAEAQGYSWQFTAKGPTTGPSLITPHPDRVMKLDWFVGRGLSCMENGRLKALSDDGKPLSDHDCIWCSVRPD